MRLTHRVNEREIEAQLYANGFHIKSGLAKAAAVNRPTDLICFKHALPLGPTVYGFCRRLRPCMLAARST